ncbi:MAG TPA: MMPL family transporter, partial [Acidimicrobiales bacterium]|nr:MMPL family transporter [Acidimicrobiales bacterium]
FVHNGDARDGVVQGLRHSSRVIVAAGLIMVAVFSAFVLSDDPNVKMIGFALAAGVLADAFVVRMTIVPAVLALLGERAWRLPRWLDRLIPNVDIEGETLAARLELDEGPSAFEDVRPLMAAGPGSSS